MTIHQAHQQLLFQLYHLYTEREAALIADWVMENVTGWKKIDRVMNQEVPLLPHRMEVLESYTTRLLKHTPVQYVLNEAWFAGMKLYVDENVLIPRPETEELVAWVRQESGLPAGALAEAGVDSQKGEYRIQNTEGRRLLDVGTGSGCIALALKKKLPGWEVHACDISSAALAVAESNAKQERLSVHFHLLNFLDEQERKSLPSFDIIVSNPPYITLKEKAAMAPNVLQHEPHLALFVENDKPLLFYEAIADFAIQKLHPGGILYVEINETLGKELSALFLQKGLKDIIVKKDMQGKERMVSAVKA